MFISREYDYALRIIRALADDRQMTVSQICQTENIPQAFAYKILKRMEKKSIVKGFRGTNGGYQLTVQLTSLTLYDVYLAIEGNLYLNECLQEGYCCANNENGTTCKIHKELLHIQKSLIELMQQRSVSEIMNT